MNNSELPFQLSAFHLPDAKSHKGQNGRLLIIGGSRLFHAASLWALQVASRIVDLVHYASVEENNKIVHKLKKEFRNGIVISRSDIEEYIEEDDCILIGPGMVRSENSTIKQFNNETMNFKQINQLKDEGVQTYYMTKYLLLKYPQKKWVIDAGALQMMEPEWIPEGAILTPHHGEFEILKLKAKSLKLKTKAKSLELKEEIKSFAREYNCVVLHKGESDIVASPEKLQIINGGNAGMTKGGTGDVLAGLVAALYTRNDAWTSAVAGSYINKKAGEDLYQKSGYWFNASDLADQIPQTMKRLLL
jgi:hydroxyethylthiazole kinase-like uncharacterized protein yjeF